MNGYKAYQRQAYVGMTRIDLVLAVCDKIIERMDNMIEAQQANETAQAKLLSLRVRTMVAGLASGVNTEASEPAFHLVRLYEYVLHCLEKMEPAAIASAKEVMQVIRDTFEQLRPTASMMQRTGQIPCMEGLLDAKIA